MRYDELDKILDSSSSSQDKQTMDEAKQRAYTKKKKIKKANMGKVYSCMMEAAASKQHNFKINCDDSVNGNWEAQGTS